MIPDVSSWLSTGTTRSGKTNLLDEFMDSAHTAAADFGWGNPMFISVLMASGGTFGGMYYCGRIVFEYVASLW
jgi:hypothetical protein